MHIIMHQEIISSLIQAMACYLFGAKPLYEPVMYRVIKLKEQNSMKL